MSITKSDFEICLFFNIFHGQFKAKSSKKFMRNISL